MHDGSLTYVVCYDISDDRRRTQLAKCLESFGSRVQWSVFEAFLTRPLVDNLLTRIGEIINSATDSVSVYPLCASCAAEVGLPGHGQPRGAARQGNGLHRVAEDLQPIADFAILFCTCAPCFGVESDSIIRNLPGCLSWAGLRKCVTCFVRSRCREESPLSTLGTPCLCMALNVVTESLLLTACRPVG